MAVFNTALSPSTNISISGATSFAVNNVVCTLAATEYNFLLPAGTKKFKLRCRGMSRLQLADISGNTNITYFTMFPGEVYEDDQLTTTTTTIYFEANKAGEVVEILTWI